MRKIRQRIVSMLVGASLMVVGATGNFGMRLAPGFSENVFAEDADGDGIDDETGEAVEQTGHNYTNNSDCPKGQIKTSVLGGTSGCYDVGDDGAAIFGLLASVLTILTYGVGTLAVVGIVVAGVQYTLSGGDVGKMTKARERIIEVVIGLICWGLLYAFLQWIIPGGVL